MRKNSYIMTIALLARQHGTYLGQFNVRGSVMDFQPALTYSEYLAMGDIVYFMYVNGRLFKIGKAGGAHGFYSRFNQYKKGRSGDSTNCRIMDVMESFQETEIEVYGIMSPKLDTHMQCPLTGKTVNVQIETHREIERLLTTQYLNEKPAHDLPFCNQLK